MSDRRDLEASLAEMDRKLRELQEELARVSRAGESPAATSPMPVMEEAAARVAELGRRVDELAGLREDLVRATRALEDERRTAASRVPPQ